MFGGGVVFPLLCRLGLDLLLDSDLDFGWEFELGELF